MIMFFEGHKNCFEEILEKKYLFAFGSRGDGEFCYC